MKSAPRAIDQPVVLIISPGGLVPVRGGGAARTLAIMAHLRKAGYRVELATANHGAHNAELEQLVDQLWLQRGGNGERTKSAPSEPRYREAVRRAKQAAKKLLGLLRTRVLDQPAAVDSALQRNRRLGIEALAGSVAYQTRPVAAIATYAWMAPALDHMPPGTLRILDTIDVQHQRREVAESNGGNLSHFACTREEENAELRRADILLAIQAGEQRTLQEMCPERRTLLVEHALETPAYVPSKPGSADVLFVGNLYDPNVIGLREFLAESWPKTRQARPDAVLQVCGRVCESVKESMPGVVLNGVVPSLDPFYERAAVVINPVRYGTGLKIKSVEALAHGRCLVCTEAGTQGLGDPAQLPLRVTAMGEPMAAEVLRLLEDGDARHALEREAYAYACARYSPGAVYRELCDAITAHTRRP